MVWEEARKIDLLSNDQSNACVAGTTRSVKGSCSDVIKVPLFFSPPPEL